MKKVLFLMLLVGLSSCSGKILRDESDCSKACSMTATKLVDVIPEGCVCQDKEKN